MKSKLFKACIICLLAAFSIKAYAKPIPGDCDKTIKDYITSHMNADFKKLGRILDDDATLKIPRQENVVTQNRSDLVSDMKAMGKVNQNCTANFEILATSSTLVIARVDFDYANTVQQNFLTLEKSAGNGWKITQVCKIFNDKDKADTTEKVIAKN